MRSIITFAVIASFSAFSSFVSGIVVSPVPRPGDAVLTKRQGTQPPANLTIAAPDRSRLPPPKPRPDPAPLPKPRPGSDSLPKPRPDRDSLPAPEPHDLPRPNPRPPLPRPLPMPGPPERPNSGSGNIPFGSGRDNIYVRYYGSYGYFHSRYNLPLVRYYNQVGFFYNLQFYPLDLDRRFLRLWEEPLFPDLNSLGEPDYVSGNISLYWYQGRFLFVTRSTAGWLPVDYRAGFPLPDYLRNVV